MKTIPIKKPKHLAPTTTEEQNTVTKGQRRINLIWEITQAIIAIMITVSTIYLALQGQKSEDLTNVFFLIVTMYFVRTNHTMVGGIGIKYGGR